MNTWNIKKLGEKPKRWIILSVVIILITTTAYWTGLPLALGAWAIITMIPSGVIFAIVYLVYLFAPGTIKKISEEIMKGLNECVVEHCCPLGDSKTHMAMDWIQYKFAYPVRNYPILVTATFFLRTWIGTFFVIILAYDFDESPATATS